MELFTELEFKVEEFDKVDKVLSLLTNEGWLVIDEHQYFVEKPNKPKELKAKKYFFRRIIL